jgi:hypothetical protein
MEFDADGYLVISVGDGSDLGDPQGHGQDTSVLLGKILRIDVDNPAGGLNYGIPPHNPFISDPLIRDEILHIGVRNPWRCDIDDLTGDLWIGDVGNFLWEEVDFLPAGQDGLNLGWNIMEGRNCFGAGSCNMTGLTKPVWEYAHSYSMPPIRCAVSGGEVYRGRRMATMQGRYLFADWCSGEVWSMRTDGVGPVGRRLHDELDLVLGPRAITGFGSDLEGEMYICSTLGGVVWKIVPDGLVLDLPQLEAGVPATLNIRGGLPNELVGIAVSRTGLGVKELLLGITLDLNRPDLFAYPTTDANGDASVTVTAPAAAAGRTSWWQAAQVDRVSNVVAEITR